MTNSQCPWTLISLGKKTYDYLFHSKINNFCRLYVQVFEDSNVRERFFINWQDWFNFRNYSPRKNNSLNFSDLHTILEVLVQEEDPATTLELVLSLLVPRLLGKKRL